MRHWIWLLYLISQIGAASGQETLHPDESSRLRTFLPQTLTRLENRDLVHVTIIGDQLAAPDSMPAVQFLNRLTRRFYYTGGVQPLEGAEFPVFVEPGISFENKTTTDATPFHLLQRLSTDALLNKPDLLIIQCGSSDCTPESVYEVWGRVGKLVPANLDVLVIGPTPQPIGDRALLEQISVLRIKERSIKKQSRDRKALVFSALDSLLPDKVAFADAGDSKHVASRIQTKWSQMTSATGLTEAAAHQISEALWNYLLQPPVTTDFAVDGRLSDGELVFTTSNASNQERIVFVGLPDPTTPTGYWSGQLWVGANPTYRFPNRLLNTSVGFDAVSTLVLADHKQIRLIDVPVSGLSELPPLSGFYQPNETLNPVLAFHSKTSRPNIKFLDMQGLTGSANGAKARLTIQNPDGAFKTPTGRMTVLWNTNGVTGRSRSYHLVAIPQLGLKQTVAMQSAETSANTDGSQIGFSAEADKNKLLLHFDLRGFTLVAKEEASLHLEMAIDAREADKRLTGGYVGRIQVRTGTKDGAAEMSPFEIALFGEGYSRVPTSTGLRAYLATRPNGDRRLTVVCDRRIFYKHEWITNNKSQLGLRATLKVQAERGESHWHLFDCPRHPNDASGLAVLDLSSPPNQAWTVIATADPGR